MQAQQSFDSEQKIELLAQAHAIASAGRKSATISRKPNVGVGITDKLGGLVKGAGSTWD